MHASRERVLKVFMHGIQGKEYFMHDCSEFSLLNALSLYERIVHAGLSGRGVAYLCIVFKWGGDVAGMGFGNCGF